LFSFTFEEAAVRRLITASTLTAAAGAAVAAPAAAAEATLSFELPRMKVAEYHRPYLAIWLERADQSPAGTIAVWYETGRDNHGLRYAKELRQWWRKQGREMALPADGISSATRAPGPQKIVLSTAKGPLATLPPGQYSMVIEVTREAGTRETVKLPVTLPLARGAAASTTGVTEIKAVRLAVK
jgi:hypothetical protein